MTRQSVQLLRHMNALHFRSVRFMRNRVNCSRDGWRHGLLAAMRSTAQRRAWCQPRHELLFVNCCARNNRFKYGRFAPISVPRMRFNVRVRIETTYAYEVELIILNNLLVCLQLVSFERFVNPKFVNHCHWIKMADWIDCSCMPQNNTHKHTAERKRNHCGSWTVKKEKFIFT